MTAGAFGGNASTVSNNSKHTCFSFLSPRDLPAGYNIAVAFEREIYDIAITEHLTYMFLPPVTMMVWPVTYENRGLAMARILLAASVGLPGLRSAMSA